MVFRIIFVLLLFSVLLVNLSYSWEASQFRWVKSDNGELLCGISPPDKTMNSVETKLQCMSACLHVCPSPCQAVNYWKKAKLCQHFYYVPTSYAVQEDCINYQVTVATFATYTRKAC